MNKIKELAKQLNIMYREFDTLCSQLDEDNQTNKDELLKQLKNKKDEIINFKKDVYAKEIFETLVNKNAKLQNKTTKETKNFIDIYGTSFEKLKSIQKMALVALVEGDGNYKIK